MTILVFQFGWLLLKCKGTYLFCLCLLLEAFLNAMITAPIPPNVNHPNALLSYIHRSCALFAYESLTFTSHYAILQFAQSPPILLWSESASDEFCLGILAQTMPCVYN